MPKGSRYANVTFDTQKRRTQTLHLISEPHFAVDMHKSVYPRCVEEFVDHAIVNQSLLQTSQVLDSFQGCFTLFVLIEAKK